MKIRTFFPSVLGCGIVAIVLLFSSMPLFGGVPGDEHWDNQFGPPGVNNLAEGIAVIGNKVYVTGYFTAAGNTKANYVAGFDGTNWFQLNSGLLGGGEGLCAVADSNYLYVGGFFTNADDPAAIDAARWDGTNWAGVGILGAAETIKRNGSNLYFGGFFSGTAGVHSTNIIGWNGTNFFALGSGLSGPGIPIVLSIAFQGNNVYAGGTFSQSGGSSMTNIAYWDGSAWHAMGNPFNGMVYALQSYGGYLYAGGIFTNTSLHFTNIARWDGGTWSAVPGGSANRPVWDFATDGTNLYIGGEFTQIGGIPASSITRFDGSVWTPLGSGLHWFNGLADANKLLWCSNQLYVAGGGFDRAGDGVGVANAARWDGTNWWGLGGDTSKGTAGSANAMQCLLNVSGASGLPNGLYAGGQFFAVGKTPANGIAWFDGTNWNALDSGVSGAFSSVPRVLALATDGFHLFVGGNFTNAGAYTGVGGVAEWTGYSWYPLGSGLDYNVNALAEDGRGALWVGGSFTNAVNAGYSKGLAVWYFGSWYNYGNVDGTNAIVSAIAYDGGTRIYVGGQFYSVGGVPATNIAYYDYNDVSWHPLGPGLNSKVNALAYGNGKLYAGGTFSQAGGLAVSRIAQWDGSNWSALGSGLTTISSSVAVYALAMAGTNLYVTGQNIANAGGVVVSNIAVWNGSNWSALGSGLEYGRNSFALAALGNDVYVGGSFNWAGDKPSESIAHWNWQSNYYPAANLKLTRSAWQTNQLFRFRVTGTSGQSYIIQGSTNLSAWVPLQTNSLMFYDFADPNSAAYPRRFYRAMLGP